MWKELYDHFINVLTVTRRQDQLEQRIERMTALSKEQEARLLNPEPGTAAAYAAACGVDLRLTVANLRLTPQQRLEQLEAKRALVKQLRAAMRQWASNDARVSALLDQYQNKRGESTLCNDQD